MGRRLGDGVSWVLLRLLVLTWLLGAVSENGAICSNRLLEFTVRSMVTIKDARKRNVGAASRQSVVGANWHLLDLSSRILLRKDDQLLLEHDYTAR